MKEAHVNERIVGSRRSEISKRRVLPNEGYAVSRACGILVRLGIV